MDTIKAIILPVIISIIGHVALISVTGMIDLRSSVRTAEVFSVDLKASEPEQKPKTAEKNEEVKPTPAREERATDVSGWREDTVDLGSLDAKYLPYLNKIKRKILQVWQYPKKSYEKNEEGIAVVRMSIDANGTMAGASLMNSSGSSLLDEGALSAITKAAPFAPLPENYNLSRLHIIASFNYKIRD